MIKDLQAGDVIQIKPEAYRNGDASDMQSPAKQGALAVVTEVEEHGAWANLYTSPIFFNYDGKIEKYLAFYPYGTFVYIGVVVYPMFRERNDV